MSAEGAKSQSEGGRTADRAESVLGAAPAPSKGKTKAKGNAKAAASPSATPTPPALDCESVKTRVMGASKLCPEEALVASSLVCSSSGHAKLLDLELACTEKSTPNAKKSPLADVLDGNTCRAVAVKDGALLSEASVADYRACMRAVQDEIVAKKCGGDTTQVEYLFLRGSHDPYVFTVRCP